MKLTTVMPVLNGDAFVSSAIQSIISQSHQNWELIVVDGKSSDRTVEIVREFVKVDKRVILVERAGSTIYEAIFEGFALATGDILSWLNSDDLYTPWAFQSVDMWMQRRDVDWVTGTPAIIDRDGRFRCMYPHIYMPRMLIKMGVFNPNGLGSIQAESTFFSRRAFDGLDKAKIETIRGSKLAGDFLLWRELARSLKLIQMPTVVGGFRIHGGNASILKQKEYEAEVKQSGALFLPRRLATLIQKLYSLSSVFLPKSLALKENKQVNLDSGLH